MKDWAEPYELWECKLAIIIITNVIIMKDWAEPYELWECKLAILATAGHPDPLLIQSIWTNIIDRSVDTNKFFYRKHDE